MKLMMRCFVALGVAIIILISNQACKSRGAHSGLRNTSDIAADRKPQVCAAIQGNGQAIFAHFHPLARMISEYGMIDAAAGQSSATMTMFLLESITQNPSIKDCNCSEKEKNDRIALALKSLLGFFDENVHRQEVRNIFRYFTVFEKLREKGFSFDSSSDYPSFSLNDAKELKNFFGALYNERFSQVVLNSPNKIFHLSDYKRSFSSGLFNVEDAQAFLRPFPISFDGITTAMGWVANFYAGRGYSNRENWDAWFEACNPSSVTDKTWGEIAYSNYTPGDLDGFFADGRERTPTSCLRAYKNLIADYNKMDKSKIPPLNRVDEKVGLYMPSIVATGLLVGDGVGKMKAALNTYWSGKNVSDLQINFDDEFRIGYFATGVLLNGISSKLLPGKASGTSPGMIGKYYPLPDRSWREALRTSPAEPTISEALEVTGDEPLVSVGGWADPFPSAILKEAGCQNIFFITSERKSFGLVKSLIRLLGAERSKTGGDFIESSLDRGLQDSDAVWCVDWSNFNDVTLASAYDLSEKTAHAGLYANNSQIFNRLTVPKPSQARYGCMLSR